MAAMPGQPSFSWRKQAVPGNSWSGLRVAKRIMSRSAGVTPAEAIALLAASRPRSDVVVWSGSTQCRSSIPDRDLIHSSEVSIHWVRSSFVTMRSGT